MGTNTKKLILTVCIYDDFANGFDHVIVELDQTIIDRIFHLNKVVLENGAFRITQFDYSCKMMASDYDTEESDNGKQPLKEPNDEPGTSTELNQLCVDGDSFCWEGNLKNSSIRWGTDHVRISELNNFDTIDNRENI